MEAEAAQIREKASRYDVESKAWATERAFLAVGLTDAEGQDIARILYERIPEAERPPLETWIKEIKADPSKAPRALAPYLAAGAANAAATNTAAANAAAGTATKTPVVPRVESTPAAGVQVTDKSISDAYKEALRTGDWKPYEALKASVLHDLGRR